MSSGGTNKTRLFLVADFETTTDPDDCRVWAWGLGECAETVQVEDVETGNTIETFFEAVSREKCVCSFHNLKFDGGFILDWLLRNGYTRVDDFPKRGQFETLIGDNGNHYSIRVKWFNGVTTEFRDSFNKLPYSVSRIAKAFKLPLSKLTIDYHETRPPGHELTDHEREYVASDVAIVAMALWQQLAQGMTRLTVGADSLKEFRHVFGVRRFERLFPVLDQHIDSDIRAAYRGGWTHIRADRRDTILEGDGAVYDANSLYPSVMRQERMPYGLPDFFLGNPLTESPHDIFYVAITFTAKLRDGFLPCIQLKGHSIFNSPEYVSEVKEPITMTVTNVDLELWSQHYEMNILSFDGGWAFKSCEGVFDAYIDKWMNIKMNETGALRELAKLHLNSLYGKFATNPIKRSKIPVLDENDDVKLRMAPETYTNPVYTPIGAIITAYARRETITAAQNNYNSFAYADTDSLHLLTRDKPKGITIDQHELGAWKHEYDFVKARFMRPKRYIEQKPDGDMVVKVAGLPHTVYGEIDFDTFHMGAEFSGKLLPRRVKGGIVLEDVKYTLN